MNDHYCRFHEHDFCLANERAYRKFCRQRDLEEAIRLRDEARKSLAEMNKKIARERRAAGKE